MIYLGIGSNLGDRKINIEKAKFKIFQNNIKILQSSNYYESLSWPNNDNPRFLNIVIKIKTDLNPNKLINLCKEIERSFGKRKEERNSPRMCDIDIIDYKNKQSNRGVILPHPRLDYRSFVLLPLFELNKSWKHPKSKSHIKSLILSLSNKDIRSIKQI